MGIPRVVYHQAVDNLTFHKKHEIYNSPAPTKTPTILMNKKPNKKNTGHPYWVLKEFLRSLHPSPLKWPPFHRDDVRWLRGPEKWR